MSSRSEQKFDSPLAVEGEDDPRAALAAGLSEYLTRPQIDALLNEALALRKQVDTEFSCRSCGQKQRRKVEISDAKAVVSAVSDLLTQGYGRPDSRPGGQSVVVNRVVQLVSEQEEAVFDAV